MRIIHVVNQASTVTGEDFGSALAAVQAQVDQDFAPVWGVGAKLEEFHAPPGDPHLVTAETIFILDDADQAGALGYHMLSRAGVPVGFVFARVAKQAGEDWSVTLSHEVLEQLADPDAARLELTTDGAGRPVAVALETADAVEGDTYPKAGVGPDGKPGKARPVSDFVYPGWFRRGPNYGRLDHLGLLKTPLTLRPGGYIPYTYDLSRWRQLTAARVAAHRKESREHSRVRRRHGAAELAVEYGTAL